MNYSQILIAISTLLAFGSPMVYAYSILKGEAKPHRVTRLVLLTTTTLSTLSLFAQHDTVAIWLSGVSFLQASFIFLLSLKYGWGHWSKQDMVCMAISFIGIVLWQTTSNPLFGLMASIVADFFGMIPTLVKTYYHPESEDWHFFAIDTVAGLLNLLAITTWTFGAVAFPAYIFAINLAVAVLAGRKNDAALYLT